MDKGPSDEELSSRRMRTHILVRLRCHYKRLKQHEQQRHDQRQHRRRRHHHRLRYHHHHHHHRHGRHH